MERLYRIADACLCIRGIDECYPRAFKEFEVAFETLRETEGMIGVDYEYTLYNIGNDKTDLKTLYISLEGNQHESIGNRCKRTAWL